MGLSVNITELRQEMERYVSEYPEKNKVRSWWRAPLLTTARADKRFEILPQIATANHLLPKDLMPSVRTVIVFFIPFKAWLSKENHPGKYPCPNWGIAYEDTNQLIENVCENLYCFLKGKGYDAVLTPVTDEQMFLARWSHKHLGYVTGLGRFGVNAQLITTSGCAGRMGSLVTNADIGDHALVTKEELCLYKVKGECLQCVARCPVKAVKVEGIDRQLCNKRLKFNRDHRISLNLGERSHGCAKCQVNLPCSLQAP